jgi:hypothetical protein
MTGEIRVSVAEVRTALASLLDEIERRHGRVVELDADYYWTIAPRDSFGGDAGDVPQSTIGQLTDDIQSMRDILTRSEDRAVVVWHDLAHIIGILNRFAALDHPAREQL